jgi:hypothetical protein
MFAAYSITAVHKGFYEIIQLCLNLSGFIYLEELKHVLNKESESSIRTRIAYT